MPLFRYLVGGPFGYMQTNTKTIEEQFCWLGLPSASVSLLYICIEWIWHHIECTGQDSYYLPERRHDLRFKFETLEELLMPFICDVIVLSRYQSPAQDLDGNACERQVSWLDCNGSRQPWHLVKFALFDCRPNLTSSTSSPRPASSLLPFHNINRWTPHTLV